MERQFNRAVLDGAETLTSEATARVFAYWNEKRGENPRPRWRDFDLMDLHEFAAMIVVKDVLTDTRDFRFRFFGSGMVEIAGFDGTHKLGSEFYNSDTFTHVVEAFWMAIDEGRPIRVAGNASVNNKDYLHYEALHLPLNDDDGNIGHLLSTYAFERDWGRG